MAEETDSDDTDEADGDPSDGGVSDPDAERSDVAPVVSGDQATGDSGAQSDRGPSEREREFAKMQRRLDERERGLDSRSEELDQRERALDEREQRLDERERELEERRDALDDREVTLRQQAETLDDREAEIEEQEAQLADRAEELGEREETLHNYIDGQVEGLTERVTETMHDALDEHDRRASGQYGSIGTMLIGLAGFALAVVGLGYALLAAAGSTAVLFDGTVANVAAGAVVLLVGLALNLGTIAGRV